MSRYGKVYKRSTLNLDMAKRLMRYAGGVGVKMGTIKGVETVIWSVCIKCKYEDCPAHSFCSLYKYKMGMIKFPRDTVVSRIAIRSEKCGAQVNYMKAVIRAGYSRFDVRTPHEDVVRFGLQIVPLYGHLFRMKLYELSLDDVWYLTNDGTRKIDPVYDEIRRTAESVDKLWKAIMPSRRSVPVKEVDKADKSSGDSDFMKAIMNLDDDAGENEPFPDEGEGVSFGEDSENGSLAEDDGVGIDFSMGNVEAPVRKDRRKRKTTKKPKNKWKKPGPKKRQAKNIPKYGTPEYKEWKKQQESD